MPRIADYAIISDQPFTIENGGERSRRFTFSLEQGLHRGSRSILAYVLYVNAGANPVSYSVTVNGSSQLVHSMNDSRVSTLHEVISANLLIAGTNTIEFQITNDLPGSLQFHDVVLFFQHTV